MEPAVGQRRHPALVVAGAHRANFDVFGFELSDADMATLNGLDDGTRFRPDPESYTGT